MTSSFLDKLSDAAGNFSFTQQLLGDQPAQLFPRVLNKYKLLPGETGVYIGRPSIWGNPFAMASKADRNFACDQFEMYIVTQPELIARAKRELKGQNLICYCAQADGKTRCHGDTWLRIANEA
jgi:hypothetical protein